MTEAARAGSRPSVRFLSTTGYFVLPLEADRGSGGLTSYGDSVALADFGFSNTPATHGCGSVDAMGWS